MAWLHRYAKLLAAATLLLVTAGAMVTSTQSGLSVPDWPNTYGYNMFLFPLNKMVGGIFYEHGHRLIASGVGLLTIGLVVFLWKVDPRRWMKRLGLVALGAVILQGTLGGITVLFLLPDAVSISHAGLAQLFFCLTVAIALFTSRSWRTPAAAPVDDARLRRRMVTLTALVYVQILLGATMRHTGAGLAIPDFPWSYGRVLPPMWTWPITIHFAHRMGALVVTIVALANVADIWRRHGGRPEFTRPAWLLITLIATQVSLGALVVLSGKQPIINTLHVATGASVLVTSLVITLRAFRARFADAPVPAARPALSGADAAASAWRTT
ncbi:MAG: COX15/CtaA family protein [Vicinamibacterales bacterium]